MNAFTEAGLDEAFYEALCPPPSPRIECVTAAPRKPTLPGASDPEAVKAMRPRCKRDLVGRLRDRKVPSPFRSMRDEVGKLPDIIDPLCGEAANRIEALEQQVDGLESALRISLWNEARGRGMTQDAALKHVQEKLAAVFADAIVSLQHKEAGDAH